MLAVPKDRLVIEHTAVNLRRILPVLPRRPILAKVPRVPEHVCTESVMLESVLSIAEAKR